ncbi:hypothetical protein BGW39_003707 [Mortierella sp. 14UC]|nr:hypothetical protein BGW39_003707 [Mortierella sp. 14UC]
MLTFFNLTRLATFFLVSSLALSSTSALVIPRPTVVSFGPQLVSYPASSSFATYAANPKLLLTPPSSSQTTTTCADDTKEQPVFQVTKSQLEDILSQTLQLDFRLRVVSDSDMNNDERLEGTVLGEIPVQIKIHKLRLGGLSAPRLNFQTLNEQRDPVNYGNIRI